MALKGEVMKSLQNRFLAGLVAVLVGIAGLLSSFPSSTEAATGLTVTNGAGGQGTNSWGTPANAQGTANNNTYATASPAQNARVAGIWNTYGFDSNLPTHAAITKVEIIAQFKVDTNLSVANLEVHAQVGGVNCPTSPIVNSAEPTIDTDFTVDVTSCRTWTRSNLLNANFATRVLAHRGNSLVGVAFTLDYVQVRVTYNTPDYNQVAYRWFDNADSTAAGGVLTATQDSVPTLYAPKDRVRLRVLLHVTTTTLITGSDQFKLQFATKAASCGASSFIDVTAATTIAYYNNPTPASNIALTTGSNNPSHLGHNTISQAYVEAAPFSTLSNVAVGEDGMWDVALVGNGASANTAYCFRMVKNDNSTLTYTIYPELVTSPSGSLNTDIVDSAGSSVASPSFGFSSLSAPFTCTSSSATFGTTTQRIRLKNTTDTAGWTLSIAATSGSGALWSAGTPKYDFNDGAGSPAGCSAGLDSDIYAGQMTMNASVGTVAARAVSMCNTTGVTKGASAAFSEGVLNAITMMSASVSAATGCYWELTGVAVNQTIPGGQATGSYSIDMTLTVVAN